MEKKHSDRLRINYIYFFFLFLFLVLSLKIFYLQVFKKDFLERLAQSQYYKVIPIEGKRGTIFDRRGRILAMSINAHSIFADPYLINNPEFIARKLALSLNLSQKDLEEKLRRKKRFVWIKRKVSLEEKEKVKHLKLKGIGFIREQKVFYPQEELASSVLGVVDIDNKGIEGVALFYDAYLRGKKGLIRVLQDSYSQELFITPIAINPQQGSDLVLTIDAQIQYWVELFLKETIEKFSAKEGSVVVMDAINGEIIALANYPNFNPNSLENIKLEDLRNRAITDMFEPGSVFKIVTLVAALEKGNFLDNDKIFCENGSFKIPGTILNDWKPYGWLSFKDVFKKSSNIGVAKIANILGKEIIYDYIKKLGFGEKTGIDLPGEVKGMVKNFWNWSKTSSFIIPIGQEIGVSLIQLVRALAVVVNGGYLVKPHILKSVNSEIFKKEFSLERRRVISKNTALKTKEILIEVVKEGTGVLAYIEGARIGGKTGTAQVYDFKIKKYSPNRYRASFVGFIDEPKMPLVIGISILEPKSSHFGGVVAAPLFKKIAEKIISYEGFNRDFVDIDDKKTIDLSLKELD